MIERRVVVRRLIAAGGILLSIELSLLSQRPQLQRGDRVREKLSPEQDALGQRGIELVVVACPGDRLRVDTGRLLVNDLPSTDLGPELVTMLAASRRLPRILPDDQYLVGGGYTVSQGDVFYKWGIYSTEQLEFSAAGPR